jgi:multicomponent Na+:H+ antiporter subunit G
VSARHVISVVLLFAGVGIEVMCCLGLLVVRDTLDRLHFTGPAAFGGLLVAVAVVVKESFSLIADKSLATAAVLLVSGPVLMHVTARTMRVRAQGDWRLQRGERVEVEDE